MRLEEWQKFIESQFLDEAAENAARQEREAAEVHAPAAAERETPALESVAVVAEIPAGMPALPLPFAEKIAAEIPVVAEAQDEPAIRAFESALDFNADLPAFENYLPAFRNAPSGTSQAKPLVSEVTAIVPATKPAVPAVPAPKTAVAAAPPPAALRPEQALPPVVAGLFDTAESEAAPGSAIAPKSELKPAETEYRAPRNRARHARNVRPEHVPSGLSAAELWAKAPRHLQALLALERLQQEEIAQSSYKRPFTEGRRELIERLLDPVLSLEDTARLLGVCPTTVRRYTNRGILTHYRKEPQRTLKTAADAENGKETRQRRFRLSDILAFLETQHTAIEADRRSEKERAQRKIPDTRAAISTS